MAHILLDSGSQFFLRPALQQAPVKGHQLLYQDLKAPAVQNTVVRCDQERGFVLCSPAPCKPHNRSVQEGDPPRSLQDCRFFYGKLRFLPVFRHLILQDQLPGFLQPLTGKAKTQGIIAEGDKTQGRLKAFLLPFSPDAEPVLQIIDPALSLRDIAVEHPLLKRCKTADAIQLFRGKEGSQDSPVGKLHGLSAAQIGGRTDPLSCSNPYASPFQLREKPVKQPPDLRVRKTAVIAAFDG